MLRKILWKTMSIFLVACMILTIKVAASHILTIKEYSSQVFEGSDYEKVEEQEIKYDDGDFEYSFYWKVTGLFTQWNPPGYMFAVKFTPPEVPSKLIRVSFYIVPLEKVFILSEPFVVVRIFDGNRNLLPIKVNVTFSQWGWCNVNLSEYDITMNEDFYIALELDQRTGLAGDISSPDDRSYWISPKEGWKSVKDVAISRNNQSYYADFGIRAVVVPIDMVVIDLSPRMGSIVVDGVEYASDRLPATFNFLRGSIHTIQTLPSTIEINNNTRLAISWSDGSEETLRNIKSSKDLRLTGYWKKQFLVKIVSEYGLPSGEGWHDAESTVVIKLSETSKGFLIQDVFDHFEGLGSKDRILGNGIAEIYVDSPRELRIVWRKDYTQLIFLIIISIIAVIILIALKKSFAKKTVEEEKTKQPVIKSIKDIKEEKMMTPETRYKFESGKVATEKGYEQTRLKNPITVERDRVVVLIGGSITVIGVTLYLGNISGIFPTFPFAGFIVMTIGGLIINSAPRVFKFQCTNCNKIMRFRITSEEKILTIKCESCQSEYMFIKQTR